MATLPPRSDEMLIKVDGGSEWTFTFFERLLSGEEAQQLVTYDEGTFGIVTVRPSLSASPIFRMGPEELDLDGILTLNDDLATFEGQAVPAEMLAAALAALSEEAPGIYAFTIVPAGDWTRRFDRLRGAFLVDPNIFDTSLVPAP